MKVLVAIDNRPSSQASMDALVKMHWHEGTEIDLLNVSGPSSGTSIDEVLTATFEEMESMAAELRNALPQCEVSCFAQSGDPKAVILQLAEQINADLIVLGSNCKSTLERLLLGSVCQSVLSAAHCPVIVAKTPCCLAREAAPGFRNILVPIDKSILSDAAVQWLGNFNWAADTKFTVVAVVDEDTDLKEVKQSLEKRAWSLSRVLQTTNITTEIASGEPHQSIVNLSKKHYADLILMGSHQKSTGLKQKILGSVSQSVLHDAPCAVAVVRGLAPETDGSRDGAFGKRKPVVKTTSSVRRDDRGDDAVHIVPAGF